MGLTDPPRPCIHAIAEWIHDDAAPRVHFSTDLGGDPDDIQLLFRLVQYPDLLDIEGISSCSGPGSDPDVDHIRRWIRRVGVRYRRRRGYEQLTSEAELLDVTVQ